MARQVGKCFNVDNLAEKFRTGRLSEWEMNSRAHIDKPNHCPRQREKHCIGLSAYSDGETAYTHFS